MPSDSTSAVKPDVVDARPWPAPRRFAYQSLASVANAAYPTSVPTFRKTLKNAR